MAKKPNKNELHRADALHHKAIVIDGLAERPLHLRG